MNQIINTSILIEYIDIIRVHDKHNIIEYWKRLDLFSNFISGPVKV